MTRSTVERPYRGRNRPLRSESAPSAPAAPTQRRQIVAASDINMTYAMNDLIRRGSHLFSSVSPLLRPFSRNRSYSLKKMWCRDAFFDFSSRCTTFFDPSRTNDRNKRPKSAFNPKNRLQLATRTVSTPFSGDPPLLVIRIKSRIGQVCNRGLYYFHLVRCYLTFCRFGGQN